MLEEIRHREDQLRQHRDLLEARVLERVAMIEEAEQTVLELFRLFLEIRIGPDWEQELVKVRQWVHKAAVN